uniref:C2H2-type domain-containing protein n=1 Tax=Octopus bimaculoides TaxID=37653 RepID=A0A0L8GDB2_OCTBM
MGWTVRLGTSEPDGCTRLQSDLAEFLQLDALPNVNHSENVVGAFTCHQPEGQSGGTGNGHAQKVFSTYHRQVPIEQGHLPEEVCGLSAFLLIRTLVLAMLTLRPFDSNPYFHQTYYIIIHKCIHTGEKPYQYEINGESSCQTYYITIHKCIHTGERPYQCDICSKSHSLQEFTINKHIQRNNRINVKIEIAK